MKCDFCMEEKPCLYIGYGDCACEECIKKNLDKVPGGYAFKLGVVAPNVPRPVPSRAASCLDCGKPYSEFPLDMVFERGDWLEINPAGNGLLCANCMCIRAAALPGVITVHARLVKPKHYQAKRPEAI